MNLHEFHEVQQGQVYGFTSGSGQCQEQIQAGREWMESSPEENALGLFVDEQLNTTQPAAQKYSHILGCTKSSAGCREREVILSFYSALMRPQLESCIQLRVPQHRKNMDLLEQQQRMGRKLIKYLN